MESGVDIQRSEDRLLERERELASLDYLIERTAAGQGGVGLVEGPAGIGKSRLVAEARRRAEDAGLRVLAARGGELEREFAFGVVRQLFEPVLAHEESNLDLLSGAASPARAVFATADADGEHASSGDASFAVLHGLFWLTVNLSTERPMLLAVDDLHWCDHASLRFLAYLIRRLEGLPVLVVCGLRPSEPGVDGALLGELTADRLTDVLQPGALSDTAVEELVRARLGETADVVFMAACRAATAGNPLLLSELLKALEAEGVSPEAVNVARIDDLASRAASRAVLVRLARLDGAATAVARALAVLGDGADLWTVAELAGVDEERAASAAGELTRAEILRAEPPLGFVHPLVGAAVYRDVPPGERSLAHERAARLLAASDAPAERIAAHLLMVPPRRDRGAVETLRRAGTAALRKGAAESAAAYFERALAEPPAPEQRPQVLLELGRAEVATNGTAAVEHLTEAYDTLTEPEDRGAVVRMLAPTLLQTGHGEESVALARRAAAELPELEGLQEELEAFEYATALFGVGDPRRLRNLERYRAPGERRGPGDKALAGMAAYEWAAAGGPADDCARLALEALPVGAGDGLLSVLPIIVLAAADREEALEEWDRALAAAHARGSLVSIAAIRLWRGWTLYRRGELVEASQDLAAGLEAGRHWGYSVIGRIYRSALRAPIDLERGDLAAARFVLGDFGDLNAEGARLIHGDHGSVGLAAEGVRLWLQSQLELLDVEARPEEAVATAEAIATRFEWVVNPALGPWRSLEARALDRLGRRDEAIALAEEEVELSRRWGAPWALGRSLRELGTLRRAEGNELLEEAAAVLDGSPARLEHAKALAALGSALRLGRKPTQAREPLRRALELATVCGAQPLVEHARSELYAAGARPRTAALTGVGSLTASERRVAGLAADGQTNRDIAQTLYVTPKTVEVHLSNAYRKLGIRSRRELTGALG